MHEIKIDFHGSTHGHFLEYVANVYIMQTAPSLCSIFRPPTYSAHAADQNYHKNKVITCGHYSNPIYKSTIGSKDIVIRILIDNKDDNLFFVALTNLMYKAGEVGVEKQMLAIPESIRNSPVDARNNWYSKFAERDLYVDYYTNFTHQSVFNFNFCSFFSFEKFCVELNRLSTFLNQTFFPDNSLYNLWTEFITHNQGWQSYVKCNQILENIFANNPIVVDCTVIEQGWLNYKLSSMCKIYQGSMFENETYPANTQLIYHEISRHLAESK